MSNLLHWLDMTSPWELAAVALALAYIVLAVRKSLWCWLAAAISSAIYVPLMWRGGLQMQAALNLFYVAMAAYGYWEWRRGPHIDGQMATLRWPLHVHGVLLVAVALFGALSGWLLLNATDAAHPYWDAWTMWGSVLATWMVARRVVDNWLYWVAIDIAVAMLCFLQGLIATSVLYIVYAGIALHGYRVWLRDRNAPTVVADAA